jgi:hypothetical protein
VNGHDQDVQTVYFHPAEYTIELRHASIALMKAGKSGG